MIFRPKTVLMGFLALWPSMGAWAASMDAMAMQKAAFYGESFQATEEDKQAYLSNGRDYLRSLLRDKMIVPFASRWLSLDPQTMQAGVEIGLSDFYQDPTSPLDMRMRVFADEQVQKYLICGRFLPIEMEMDSSYGLLPNLKLQAKLEAPFNDFMRLKLGSQYDWTSRINSSLQYNLHSSPEEMDSLALGMGYNLMDWRWRFFFEVNSSLVSMQYFSITTDF